MVLLNAPDAKQRILKSCNVTGFDKSDLEFIAKHSNSTPQEIKKASETMTGEKVPVTLFVEDLEEANDIYLEAVKRKVNASPLEKTATVETPITPATPTFKTVMESRIKKLKDKQCQ